MTRSSVDHLEDMLNALQRARRHVGTMDATTFGANEMALDAAVRTLEILGEAAKRVPEDVKRRESEIPWREMIGMRDLVIHAYHRVDATVVWRTVRDALPGIEPLIASALERQRLIEGDRSD